VEIPVIGQSGETVETIQLDDAVFNVPMNNSLVHQALVAYQLNKRHGTHSTKTRGEVSGGGRKPWIQKHTGRARQGSIRSPQWRHGGVVFGPHPRSYRKAIPRRMRRTALRCVLSQKAREGQLVCLNSLDTVNGKTRSMIDLMANLGISGSALLVTQGSDTQVIQAAHNVKKVWTLPVSQLNAQELLSRETLVITLEAVRWAEECLVSDPHGRLARSGAYRAGNRTAPETTPPETTPPEAEEPPVDASVDGSGDPSNEED
jgi:large subunit ribosomal protein L4